MLLPLLIAAIVGYLLGSLPFGYLVAKAKGVNIFEVGSKNPGATNVRRVLGSGPGNFVFVLDALKGALAVGWICAAAWLVPLGSHLGGPSDNNHYTWFYFRQACEEQAPFAIAGLAGALLGHSYSCFTKFRGGKGVATTAGGFLVLMPVVLVIAVAVWWITFKLSRYVSLASILAALTLPTAAFFLHESPLLLGLAAVIAVFVTIRHRANIVRLCNGTENKFVKKPAAPDTPAP
jgi:glycerol-3-phosphate acyltransferase PlsY